ncbi:hypothetical protein B0T26DRAFT_254223 [Lasiosphaeria miniovina]|uniref:Uncharacterized protein n=1 Tax=Lasiosphaeria miniovina TaxID=1954250 RepID=A0AA40E0A0_9PEZI|nr:uncharacterized protein B0T26DRAFT_254223 [Lasiosphaeria miniovina]KAK0723184.1 hypothetical protein B0T26DRAFT_254223 [Lasiosphaeria miniovina]
MKSSSDYCRSRGMCLHSPFMNQTQSLTALFQSSRQYAFGRLGNPDIHCRRTVFDTCSVHNVFYPYRWSALRP